MTESIISGVIGGAFAGIGLAFWLASRKNVKYYERMEERFCGLREFYEWARKHEVSLVVDGEQKEKSGIVDLYTNLRFLRSSVVMEADNGPALYVTERE